MTFSSELLPAPLGPIKAQISAVATRKLMSVTALTPLNDSEICSSSSKCAVAVWVMARLLSGQLRLEPAPVIGGLLHKMRRRFPMGRIAPLANPKT
ncbi:hypothetical protein FQZ97_1109540 [compost metagenome]